MSDSAIAIAWELTKLPKEEALKRYKEISRQRERMGHVPIPITYKDALWVHIYG